jgi:hypothetical protein
VPVQQAAEGTLATTVDPDAFLLATMSAWQREVELSQLCVLALMCLSRPLCVHVVARREGFFGGGRER